MGIIDADLSDIMKLKPRLAEPLGHMDWIIDHARLKQQEGFATSFFFVDGYFECGCGARGFSQFCMDIMTDRDLVRALWDVWE